MQDITSLESAETLHSRSLILEKQKLISQQLLPTSSRNPFSTYEGLQLSSASRKMLETVLINSEINNIPTSKEQFLTTAKFILSSEDLANKNVALIIRS